MEKYRKKPIIIEAVKVEDNFDSIKEALLFMGEVVDLKGNNYQMFEQFCHHCHKQGGLTIETLEGDMLASFGDMIIKGVNGEYYPCKPDIFEKTYEKIQEQNGSEVNLSHLQIVMPSRFDEEIEKVMSMVEWSDQRDRKMVLDLFQKMQSAILHQKISET